MKKRGAYFFVLDALIGGTILLISLVIIFNSYLNTPDTKQSYILAEDITSFLVNAKIHEFIDETVLDMIEDGEISDIETTFLQQIAMFHNDDINTCGLDDDLNCANNLTVDIMNALLPGQYGYRYKIEELNPALITTIAERGTDREAIAKFSLSSRKLTFFKTGPGTMYGPAITEVLVWS